MTENAARKKQEIVVTTLRLPRELITDVRIQAIRAGRTLNAHLVEVLKVATGANLGGHAPAAVKAQDQNHSEAQSHAAE